MEQPGAHQALDSLKLVPFRDVLENVCQEAHAGLQALADRLPTLEDQQRCVCEQAEGTGALGRACASRDRPHRGQHACAHPPPPPLPPILPAADLLCPPPTCPLPQQGRAAAAPADHAAALAAPACVCAVGTQGQGGQHMPGGAEGVAGPQRRAGARRWGLRGWVLCNCLMPQTGQAHAAS